MKISNPKNTKWRHNDVIIVFLSFLCKTRPRQFTLLKLFRLIALDKVHQICKFEDHVTRNDVIMMSLPKTMKNLDVRETSQIVHHSKGLDESYSKM